MPRVHTGESVIGMTSVKTQREGKGKHRRKKVSVTLNFLEKFKWQYPNSKAVSFKKYFAAGGISLWEVSGFQGC